MRYLSLCSGIEAASVAWSPLGWEPIAFSEIEPFPCAVLAHHYPDVPNLGDMTKVQDWRKYHGAVDLVVGGTPCQGFSVAGKRGGMADPRSGLAECYANLVSDVQPRWIVWENVPGVLSSGRGRDFRAFIRQLAECGYGVSWRVLDAQYFGVPQRRRRVFVVGYFGDWRPAVSVLFEPPCFCRNTPPRKEKRPRTAQPAAGSPDESGERRIVRQAISCKWAKGTSGPAGDEHHNLICAPIAPTITMSGPPYNRTGNSRVEAEALIACQHSRVRRITPRECERLQGFPDDYTAIEFRGKPASDGPRYKALGNSMAVPVMRWIGERIAKQDVLWEEIKCS